MTNTPKNHRLLLLLFLQAIVSGSTALATPFRTDNWPSTRQVTSHPPVKNAATSDDAMGQDAKEKGAKEKGAKEKGAKEKKPTAAELRTRALAHREWLNKLLTDYYKQYPEADLDGDGKLTSPERSFHVAKLYRQKTLKELGDQIRFQGEIEYAKVESVSLKLDLYLPANIDPANKPPVVVWFHGGGWRGGSKDHCIVAWLATKNFAVASVEYRSVLQWPFPNNIHDCKAAIRWLRANADKYGYDARRVGTTGASAGGHLAAIMGTSAEVESLEGKVGNHLDQSSRIQAVIDMAGVASIPDWTGTPRGLSLILGIPFSEDNGAAELGELCSADTHVTEDDPPILLMHGDNDQVVPLKQSQDFYKICKQARLDATLEIIPRGGHAGAPFVDDQHKAMIKSFLDQHLRQ